MNKPILRRLPPANHEMIRGGFAGYVGQRGECIYCKYTLPFVIILATICKFVNMGLVAVAKLPQEVLTDLRMPVADFETNI